MSDNIPFHIQMEIIEKVSDAKSLIRFRSVSKRWKAFIDSSQFIKGYGARHTQQPNSRILSYRCDDLSDELRYICLVEDDDIETFKVQQQQEFVMSPLLKQYHVSYVVGESHGLLCLYCNNNNNEGMLVIWNPCIGKSFGIAVPTYDHVVHMSNYWNDFSFGVCPVTSDPTVVMTVWLFNMLLSVEVFTLSSGVWNRILSDNYPRESIKFSSSNHVVIDRFIYWAACENTFKYMVVSFDMITKEFKVIDLPNSLTNELSFHVSVSKLRGSLVLWGYIGTRCYGVWVMEHDSSFRKLFNIGASFCSILGFMKNGEPIFEIREMDRNVTTLNIYDPSSQQIKSLGISGLKGSFFMGTYKESLLLLDHSDLHVYSDDH